MIHSDAFLLRVSLCRTRRYPLAVPGTARRGHLLVGAEYDLSQLGQVYMAVAAGGLDHVPLVGAPVPLAVHHRA